MRTVALMMLACTACWAEAGYGIWNMRATRSTFSGGTRPKRFAVRIEPHAKGEVFTLDSVEADGRITSASTILYLDGEPREFQDSVCTGMQSSRRVDGRTVEILRVCANGEWIRWIRRSGSLPGELVLEITEHQPDGRRLEQRVLLEKQAAEKR